MSRFLFIHESKLSARFLFIPSKNFVSDSIMPFVCLVVTGDGNTVSYPATSKASSGLANLLKNCFASLFDLSSTFSLSLPLCCAIVVDNKLCTFIFSLTLIGSFLSGTMSLYFSPRLLVILFQFFSPAVFLFKFVISSFMRF